MPVAPKTNWIGMSLERQSPLRLVALAAALIAWPPVRSTTSLGLDRRACGSRCRPYSPRELHRFVYRLGLITSQIDTAPKRSSCRRCSSARLITSQIDTAPKLGRRCSRTYSSLITSQINTAPKRKWRSTLARLRLITSQIDTAPKLRDEG